MDTMLFDKHASTYDTWYTEHEKLFQSELKLYHRALGDVANKKLLSIGCGTGIFESTLQGADIDGLEPASKMATIAKKRGIKVIEESIHNHNIKKDYYDIIYFNTSSPFISDIETAYNKAYSALKSGGKLVIFDIPKESAYCLMYMLSAHTNIFREEYPKEYSMNIALSEEVVKNANWHSAEERVEILKKIGVSRFEYYQTLTNNPLYQNDEVEEVLEGYKKGSYVAIIAYK